MRIFLSLLITLIIALPFESLGWGKTGHRVVGQIAYNHLSKKAKKNLQKILGDEHLGMVGNYMDFIRAESKYDHMSKWHYCSIPDGKTYEEAGTPEEGDAIVAITRLLEELKTKKFTEEDEKFALKCLVHLIADIHQPLHVGNGEDAGGNRVKVTYMWESSNLHRVWDSGMIDQQQLSYTEYTNWVDVAKESDVQKWQSAGLMDWIYESMSYRDETYIIPEDNKLSYRYTFDNIALVNQRLLQAGIRLAGVLNDIYGS